MFWFALCVYNDGSRFTACWITAIVCHGNAMQRCNGIFQHFPKRAVFLLLGKSFGKWLRVSSDTVSCVTLFLWPPHCVLLHRSGFRTLLINKCLRRPEQSVLVSCHLLYDRVAECMGNKIVTACLLKQAWMKLLPGSKHQYIFETLRSGDILSAIVWRNFGYIFF